MTLWRVIAGGEKVSSLITMNMEAMVRTIIYIGCSKDWPNYLNSKEYLEWKQSNEKTKTASQKPDTRLHHLTDDNQSHSMEDYCQQDDSDENDFERISSTDEIDEDENKIVKNKNNNEENKDNDLNNSDDDDNKKRRAVDTIEQIHSDDDSKNSNSRVNQVSFKNTHSSKKPNDDDTDQHQTLTTQNQQ